MDKIPVGILDGWIHHRSRTVMETVEIICTNNDRTKTAEVLERKDNYMKVQVEGTQLFIEMFREDLNTPYTGHTAGLEFECQPKN